MATLPDKFFHPRQSLLATQQYDTLQQWRADAAAADRHAHGLRRNATLFAQRDDLIHRTGQASFIPIFGRYRFQDWRRLREPLFAVILVDELLNGLFVVFRFLEEEYRLLRPSRPAWSCVRGTWR